MGAKIPREGAFRNTEKSMQTFRMTQELITFLKTEASSRGLDLTAHVNHVLEGHRTWFALPAAAVRLIEADREAWGLKRYEYLLQVLYQRSNEVREKGPGFDLPPDAPKQKKRERAGAVRRGS